MKEKIIVRANVVLSIVLIFSLVMVNHVQASETKYEEIKTTTYQFLQFVKEGHNQAAIAKLNELKRVNEMHSIVPEEKLSYDELNTLINETQFALQDTNTSPEEKYHRALTVVLLYDSTWNEQDALWVTWKSYLEDEISRVLEAEQITNGSIQHLYSLYERLLPALKVSLGENEFRIMKQHQDSFLAFLSGKNQQEKLSFIYVLSSDLKKIPSEKEEEKSFTEEPGFIWLLFSVGGLIISTLSYVGWRKYRGESDDKEEHKERGS
ncbi:sporulation protein YpjB [Pontibacillus marinus]|uniref:Sporulation protein YpjB n=1 Tax=Pontibacillus marinus BH030004 = DSM 16465 TaxID=1385511 RepID=A0A0A5HKD4_9BACI|nr:sporulation protein YpjB [Pontibacillus marinus]KGX84082.1 hypothetical protein N783_19100 [Pontibacillus marinus BH030004 = DSM 16465]